MFVFVADLTKQVLFLLNAGKRRVPVKVVGAVCLTGKDWGAPSTVSCREEENSNRSVLACPGVTRLTKDLNVHAAGRTCHSAVLYYTTRWRQVSYMQSCCSQS